MKVIVATNNKGKLAEIREMLGGFPIELYSLDDIGLKIEFEETGDTFEENALIKARAVYNAVGSPVISDDSGLCVEALGGAPGIYTSRYSGENAGDDENIDKLLDALTDVPQNERSARFVCAIAYIDDTGDEYVFSGECAGRIAFERSGADGMGYDPVFFYPPAGVTFAQLDPGKKNKVSHRNAALTLFKRHMASSLESHI